MPEPSPALTLVLIFISGTPFRYRSVVTVSVRRADRDPHPRRLLVWTSLSWLDSSLIAAAFGRPPVDAGGSHRSAARIERRSTTDPDPCFQLHDRLPGVFQCRPPFGHIPGPSPALTLVFPFMTCLRLVICPGRLRNHSAHRIDAG